MAAPPLPLRFVMSAMRVEDLPPTEGEVAIVGRSNVGKSSLINALANRKELARTSKTPGRTQALNLFELGNGTTVVDLPGFGFANAPKRVRAAWGPMIEDYLLTRDHLGTVVVLVDAEIGPTPIDRTALDWLRSHELTIRIVASKYDKVKPSTRERRKREVAEGCGVAPGEIVWASSAKNLNIGELRNRLPGWARGEPR
ncbi:MAG: GTP-binding protein EngB [Acidimicrobiales bacterium]|nr:GTP-binding protein EngB [Acidimicrobiales bacterium]